MVAVTKLARTAEPERTTTYLERRFTVGQVTAKAVGVETDERELYTDPRSGWCEERAKLVWLPRSQVRLVAGEYEPGAEILLEVPAWLVRKNDL